MPHTVHCKFEWVKGKQGMRYRCKRCGFEDAASAITKIDRIYRTCSVRSDGTPVPKPPPLYKRLANFSVAAIGHVLAGMPTCTQEQIDERLAVCQACPLFKPSKSDPDKGVCTHTSCGCTAGRESKFLNKLAWADQQCPEGKWKAIGD